MDQRQKKELAEILQKGVEFECPMSRYTTFRVGGPVEALCIISDLEGLQRMVPYLGREKIPYLVVGRGSNLLVRDDGFRGVAIILREKLANVEPNGKSDQIVLAGGGLALFELLDYCKGKGLGGLEFLAGIPGTAGGAVAMNAGAWGCDVGSRVQQIQIVTSKGELETLGQSRLKFKYRALSIPKGSVITSVKFELNRESPEVVIGKLSENLKKRHEKQPSQYPSGGSVFKNPPQDYAGRLIEKTGLKGKRVGGAMISPKHANFIVNTGGARAADILALMDLARKKVKEQMGVELEPEIRVIG
jgi:UDP-N-acetylmuramate dehydrogenase